MPMQCMAFFELEDLNVDLRENIKGGEYVFVRLSVRADGGQIKGHELVYSGDSVNILAVRPEPGDEGPYWRVKYVSVKKTDGLRKITIGEKKSPIAFFPSKDT